MLGHLRGRWVYDESEEASEFLFVNDEIQVRPTTPLALPRDVALHIGVEDETGVSNACLCALPIFESGYPSSTQASVTVGLHASAQHLEATSCPSDLHIRTITYWEREYDATQSAS